jgi:cytochrome c peroxidase
MQGGLQTRALRENVMRIGWKLAVPATLLFNVAVTPVPANDENDRLGLPTTVDPADNPSSPQKIALGARLFFDKGLSADGSVSCASCHRPERVFSDGLAQSVGIGRKVGTRNAPSLVNAGFQHSQFWDGRRSSLEAQAADPLVNPSEHGLPDHEAALRYVRQDPGYKNSFLSSFGVAPAEIRMWHVSAALAAFERTLIAGNSPFDRYFFTREGAALSASAVRGLALFQGRAQCASCHLIEPAHALFTDDLFHSLSVGMKSIDRRLAALTTELARQQEQGGSPDPMIMSDRDIAQLGRFAVTLDPADIGKFRTPSLRNVALTAPYMHDGSIDTLEDAVEYEIYYRGAARGYPLILTPEEKRDLAAFLESLTSAPATRARLTASNPSR